MLRSWSAPDGKQEALRRRYLAHLQRHPDGWSRSCPGEHLTASSLLCALDRPAVLLTLHARLGRWLQTGGHLEPADTGLAAAARREAEEESGLTGLVLDPAPLLLSAHALPPSVPCAQGLPMTHLDVQHLVTVRSARPPVVSAESTQVAWFAPDRLPPVDASVSALVAAAAERVGW